jgi:hypothetical protein
MLAVVVVDGVVVATVDRAWRREDAAITANAGGDEGDAPVGTIEPNDARWRGGGDKAIGRRRGTRSNIFRDDGELVAASILWRASAISTTMESKGGRRPFRCLIDARANDEDMVERERREQRTSSVILI